ncbi:MAG: glycosyltransferase family 4 protein [Candidatus Heimdallarchaeota archaeon]
MAGSEVYSLHLAKQLNEEHDVVVFHRIENPFLKEYEIIRSSFNGLEKYMINIPYLPHYFEGRYINRKVEKIFEDFLNEYKPDIIHFGHLNYLSTNLVKIARTSGYPTIFTLHDFWLYCPRGQLINRRNDDLCYNLDLENCARCLDEYLGDSVDVRLKIRDRIDYIQNNVVDNVDLFLAPSKFLMEKMIEFGIPSNKITYLDYGFNFDFFKDYKKIKSEKIRFGYIGRIIPTKGIHLIVDAFNRIENERVEMRIYGSSSTISYLKSRATNPNILFLGSYENWEISKVLAEIDVLIVPSIWFENSPLVIHEAAMVKIPIITSNLGGMAEYVKDNINGLLFERNNSNDLKEKIMVFINNPELIEKFSEKSMEVDSIEEHTSKILEFYNRIIEER